MNISSELVAAGPLTMADFERAIALLQNQKMRTWEVVIHPDTARWIDWWENKPMLRELYASLGYPRGRNQGAFKDWALSRGRYKNGWERQ